MPGEPPPIWFEGRWRRLGWDERKRRTNIAKHGIDFAALPPLFSTPYLIDFDSEHSDHEERWRLLGMLRQRVAVFVVRIDAAALRVISARYADDEETRHYYENCFGG